MAFAMQFDDVHPHIQVQAREHPKAGIQCGVLCLSEQLLPVQEQTQIWDDVWFIKMLKTYPDLLVNLFVRFISLFCFNRFTMW